MTNKEVKTIPFLHHFIAGAGAGMLEILAMYPLDVVKTRFQLQVNNKKFVTSTVNTQEYTSMFNCMKQIVKQEGFISLYKGMSSPLLMEVPKRATKFACNDKFQSIFKNILNTNNVDGMITILSGTMAGLVESTIVVPFELVKIRLQDKGTIYKGPRDCVYQTIKKEGIFSLYKGLEATIWRNSIWNASYFGLIYGIKKNILSINNKNNNKLDNRRNDFIAGTIAGCLSCLLSVPFDVIKTRIQSTHNLTVQRNWTLPSVYSLYRIEGIRGIYKGLIPIISRYGPGGGLLLVVYSGIIEIFEKI